MPALSAVLLIRLKSLPLKSATWGITRTDDIAQQVRLAQGLTNTGLS